MSIAINIIFDEQKNIEERELRFVLPLETTLRRRIPFYSIDGSKSFRQRSRGKQNRINIVDIGTATWITNLKTQF